MYQDERYQDELSVWTWTQEVVSISIHIGLIVFSYAMSRYLEKQLHFFLFLKFQSKMIKSHESEQHRPVQKIYMTEDFVWMTAIWHQNYKPNKSKKNNSQLHFIIHIHFTHWNFQFEKNCATAYLVTDFKNTSLVWANDIDFSEVAKIWISFKNK